MNVWLLFFPFRVHCLIQMHLFHSGLTENNNNEKKFHTLEVICLSTEMRKEIKLNKMNGKRSTITTAAETVLIFMCIVCLEKPTTLKHTVTKSNYLPLSLSVTFEEEACKVLVVNTKLYKKVYFN